MAPLIPLEFRKAETKGRKQAVLSPCAHFSISACSLTKALYLLFFYNMESIFFSTSSLDHLRVHCRARLSILLSDHVPCRCDTGHNKAHQVNSVSLLMLLSWDQVTSGHRVTPLQENICWGTRVQHRSQGRSGAWRAPAALLWGICCFLPGYNTQVPEHSTWSGAAGLGQTQMVLSGRSHTFEADIASQSTCCSGIGDIFRN